MKHVLICLTTSNDRESSFYHSGGPVKLVQACLRARKVSLSGFNLPRGFVKLLQVYLNVRKDLERIFSTLEIL